MANAVTPRTRLNEKSATATAARPNVPPHRSTLRMSHCVTGKISHEGSSALMVHTGLLGHASPEG
eukprot:7124767-Prymnesium_polylepis.1